MLDDISVETIFSSEIEKAISSVKSNKLCGSNKILNEHIKSCYNTFLMQNILSKYFNMVIDSGLVKTFFFLLLCILLSSNSFSITHINISI